MKKRSLLLTSVAGIMMLLASCGQQPQSSGQTGISSSTSGGGGGTSQSSDTSKGSTSSSSDSGGKEKEDVIYQGKLRIWYHRDSMNYDKLAIYLWNSSVDGKEYEFTGDDEEYGRYIDIDLSENEQFKDYPSTDIRLIVKVFGTWSGQSLDTFCYFKDYDVDENGVMNIFLAAGEGSTIETFSRRADALGDRFDVAYIDSDWKKIVVTGTGTKGSRQAADVGKISSVKLYGFTTDYYKLNPTVRAKHDEEYLLKTQEFNDDQAANSITLSLDQAADPSIQYEVRGTFLSDKTKQKSKAVSVRRLYDTETFKTNYVYDGSDLGCTVNADGTKTLKLWAPTTSYAQVRFYLVGTPWNLAGRKVADLAANFPMEKEMGSDGKWHGVWSFKTDEKTNFYEWYTYVVTNSNGTVEAVDPYAKATGLNGERAYMVDWNDANEADPEGWNNGKGVTDNLTPIKAANNLTVYEAHIRDLTADETWTSNKNNLRGTYNAFAEEGTTYSTVKTGFDHIKELGVNAIQLLPVFDQDNDERKKTVYESTENGGKLNEASYNWGYNPQNYNVVEGAYSSDPEKPMVRVKEFKNLIQTAAKNDIRVIMDVVYNHMTSVANNSFTKIVPQYFFRTDAAGNYTDGSGCGNEFASDRTMASKFIVDSVSWWAKEYEVKGFRFDLMGCIDVDTMKAVRAAVNEIDPTIVLYGEGWTGGGTALDGSKQSSTGNIYSQLNTDPNFPIGGFNDHGRDGAKGNTSYGSPYPASGWVNQGSNVDKVYNTVTQILGENRHVGSTPNQTINYLACHDNYTLYDQINYLFYNHDKTFDDGSHEFVMQAATALNAMTIFGQGVAFINGGDEIFRQKLITSDNPLWEDLRESYKFGRYEEWREGSGWASSSSSRPRGEPWADFGIGDRYYDANGNRVYQRDGESWDSFKARFSKKVSDWIEGDGIEINANTWLVRNSYKYGDAVNAYKWDRKADPTVNKYYQEWVKAVKLRGAEMGNTLGQSKTEISAGGTTCWNYTDLFNVNEKGEIISSKTDVLAGAFKGKDGKYVYIFLNKGNDDTNHSIGIGNGSFETLLSTTGAHPATFQITNNSIEIGKFECLIVRQTA